MIAAYHFIQKAQARYTGTSEALLLVVAVDGYGATRNADDDADDDSEEEVKGQMKKSASRSTNIAKRSLSHILWLEGGLADGCHKVIMRICTPYELVIEVQL